MRILFVGDIHYPRNTTIFRKLQKFLEKERIIVLLHFVPLREFILVKNDSEDFWNAYLGSPKLGDLIKKYKGIVKFVFFGHVDTRFLTEKEIASDGIRFINVDVSLDFGDRYLLEL